MLQSVAILNVQDRFIVLKYKDIIFYTHITHVA